MSQERLQKGALTGTLLLQNCSTCRDKVTSQPPPHTAAHGPSVPHSHFFPARASAVPEDSILTMQIKWQLTKKCIDNSDIIIFSVKLDKHSSGREEGPL